MCLVPCYVVHRVLGIEPKVSTSPVASLTSCTEPIPAAWFGQYGLAHFRPGQSSLLRLLLRGRRNTGYT